MRSVRCIAKRRDLVGRADSKGKGLSVLSSISNVPDSAASDTALANDAARRLASGIKQLLALPVSPTIRTLRRLESIHQRLSLTATQVLQLHQCVGERVAVHLDIDRRPQMLIATNSVTKNMDIRHFYKSDSLESTAATNLFDFTPASLLSNIPDSVQIVHPEEYKRDKQAFLGETLSVPENTTTATLTPDTSAAEAPLSNVSSHDLLKHSSGRNLEMLCDLFFRRKLECVAPGYIPGLCRWLSEQQQRHGYIYSARLWNALQIRCLTFVNVYEAQQLAELLFFFQKGAPGVDLDQLVAKAALRLYYTPFTVRKNVPHNTMSNELLLFFIRFFSSFEGSLRTLLFPVQRRLLQSLTDDRKRTVLYHYITRLQAQAPTDNLLETLETSCNSKDIKGGDSQYPIEDANCHSPPQPPSSCSFLPDYDTLWASVQRTPDDIQLLTASLPESLVFYPGSRASSKYSAKSQGKKLLQRCLTLDAFVQRHCALQTENLTSVTLPLKELYTRYVTMLWGKPDDFVNRCVKSSSLKLLHQYLEEFVKHQLAFPNLTYRNHLFIQYLCEAIQLKTRSCKREKHASYATFAALFRLSAQLCSLLVQTNKPENRNCSSTALSSRSVHQKSLTALPAGHVIKILRETALTIFTDVLNPCLGKLPGHILIDVAIGAFPLQRTVNGCVMDPDDDQNKESTQKESTSLMQTSFRNTIFPLALSLLTDDMTCLHLSTSILTTLRSEATSQLQHYKQTAPFSAHFPSPKVVSLLRRRAESILCSRLHVLSVDMLHQTVTAESSHTYLLHVLANVLIRSEALQRNRTKQLPICVDTVTTLSAILQDCCSLLSQGISNECIADECSRSAIVWARVASARRSFLTSLVDGIRGTITLRDSGIFIYSQTHNRSRTMILLQNLWRMEFSAILRYQRWKAEQRVDHLHVIKPSRTGDPSCSIERLTPSHELLLLAQRYLTLHDKFEMKASALKRRASPQ